MPAPESRDDVLHRFPRLVAHLICESLGYFTPEGAAGAILDVKQHRPTWCEWYVHMASVGKRPVEDVGLRTLERAIRGRHMHRGFMAEYRQARLLVERVRQTGDWPLFASWF